MDIPLHILEKITNNFSEEQKIGSGEYGDVYKGVYNGEDIAVKLLHHVPEFDENLFRNEFANVMSIKHPNVVRLVGYCYEIKNKHVDYKGEPRFCQYIYRLLCFEYLQGGSLDKYLKQAEESHDYDWCTRYNIIKGICEGLNFLHGGCGSQILHLDLKPANVLLDKNIVLKIADFGLSRLFRGANTHATQKIIGTPKYMPPEYKYEQLISHKNDVFSLGVTILEVMAGPAGYNDFCHLSDVKNFIELINTNWRKQINATSLCPAAELDQVETCIRTAIKCVDHDRNNRPTVAEIMDILEETEKRFPEKCRNNTRFLMGQKVRAASDELIKIKSDIKPVWCLDVHRTEPWILMANGDSQAYIWNYQTQEMKQILIGKQVLCAIFIVREQWIVAGASDGQIYVYGYGVVGKIRVLRAHSKPVRCLAIHATEPYLLSGTPDGKIMLWDYKKDWQLITTFDAKYSTNKVAFNPKDTDVFASAQHNTVKIWDLHSGECKLELSGHSSPVSSLDYFSHNDKVFLISSSSDHTAKIWDCEDGTCVQTLEGHTDDVRSACCHPDLPILFTGSWDGSVRLWNSTTFRLERILNFNLEQVFTLACLKGSTRIAIGHYGGLVLADIDPQRTQQLQHMMDLQGKQLQTSSATEEHKNYL